MNTALRELEAEAVYVIREVVAQFERPALLFSGGKDSTVIAHLASKAFAPAPIPFPLLHVDTGHNFPETLEFRDRLVERLGIRLAVHYVQDSIDAGLVSEETGPRASRNALQTVTLLSAISALNLDACIGGARRDEEKARAKERFFSHRNTQGQWDPKSQRPELWNLFDGRKHKGEHFRVFPLNNWTELDVWRYIAAEAIELPSLYFSHERETIERDGTLWAWIEYIQPEPGEVPVKRRVRFRTVGDATCTAAMLSEAATVEDVIRELLELRVSERASRMDDRRSESAMEDRKARGYF
ncbi:MAG TPA: sulfate adenylyltransferase subunit CysD [Fimbriimonadaceae bacterium]|nr:sulfate adenylyltransferase subunit CysD [Fimbriimonadaceae bacterium]